MCHNRPKPTIGEVAAKLQRRFEDCSLQLRQSEADGKMIPRLSTVARICDDMAHMAVLIQKLSNQERL